MRQLLAAGHRVAGITREEAGVRQLRESGAEPVICDALDRDALIAALVDARPDAVIHELTAIPDDIDPRKIRKQFERTNRLIER